MGFFGYKTIPERCLLQDGLYTYYLITISINDAGKAIGNAYRPSAI